MLLKPLDNVPEISFTRQPIYDEKENTFAYELLFKDSNAEFSCADDNNPESSQIIANVVMEVGLKLLVGDKPAFINLPHSFITERQSIPFAKDKFILEIKADQNIDCDLLNAISDLHEKSFNIALVNPTLTDSTAPVFEQCKLIKIDITKHTTEDLAALIHQLSIFGKPFLASKVDSQTDFEKCKALGFRYFQGTFLNQPKVVKFKTLPINKVLLLQILATVQNTDVSFSELEEIIGQDVGISFKLLRLINSANFGLSQKVESLHQALLLLGLKEIKSWVSLVALSNIDSTPQELSNMSIARARMCKLLAIKAGRENPDTYFTIGMFSLLDAIMSKSMKSILKSLPFSEEINDALIFHKGDMGQALDCVIAHEQGEWHMMKFGELTPIQIKEIYIDTLEWCRGVQSQLIQS